MKSEGAVYRLEDILGPPDLDPIVTQTAATSTSSNTTSSSSSQSSSSALQLSPHTPAGRLAAHLADSQDLLDVLTESEEGLAAEIEVRCDYIYTYHVICDMILENLLINLI